MKARIILAAVTLLFLFRPAFAQQIGQWKNYSNMQNVRSSRGSSEGIWAATSGGAFFFSFSDSTYLSLQKSDGLSNNSLTAMAIDKSGKIWFGGEDGSIDIYNIAKKTFEKKILDISSLDKGQKKINYFSVTGDSVFVATDFGISLISSSDFTFQDTYLKLGNFPSDTKVNSVYHNSLLYAATENGVAAQKPGTTNLSAPESWLNYTTSQGLPSNNVFRIAGFKDTVIAATSLGLSFLNGDFWNYYLPQFTGIPIVDLLVKGDSLFIVGQTEINLYYNGKVTLIAQAQGKTLFTGIASAGSHGLFAATTSGLQRIPSSGGNPVYYYPEGPASNIFTGLSVDKDGNLWAGSGTSDKAVGFYIYNGQKWANYSSNNVPSPNNDLAFFRIYISPDNTPYVMNWGEGFLRYKNGHFQLFNHSNTPLDGIPGSPDYVVVNGLSTDSKGNLWVLTYRSANKTNLYELKTDSTWDSFTSSKFFNKVMLGFDLLADQYDTKFFLMNKEETSAGDGVYFFNKDNPLYPNGPNDDNGFGVVTTNDGLGSSSINALVIDRRGELWVGTSAGVNVIPDTRDPRANISTIDPLRSRVVNCIAVDALNQKWIGTQQGVFVVSSDGTQLIKNYTTSNSPLPSDIVRSIAIDNNTGTVYMGTDFGLASVTTTAVKPQESFTGMFVYPNPVIVQNGSPVTITIEGLVRDSDIKILSISGKVLNTFASPGAGVAQWDGKDMDGNLVPSGIYIIVAYDKDGTNVSSAKVAILRK